MIIPARAGRYFQMAWVVDDLSAAIEDWIALTGIGPFFVIENVQLAGLKFRGAPADHLSWGAAIAQAGEMQIEFIQPHGEAASPYSGFTKRGAPAFHHVAAIATDLDAEIARYLDLGCPLLSEGETGPVRFAMIDTFARQGCYTELVADHPMVRQSAQVFIDAAKGWDGERPVRSLYAELEARLTP